LPSRWLHLRRPQGELTFRQPLLNESLSNLSNRIRILESIKAAHISELVV
jgi:hypothetical protein